MLQSSRTFEDIVEGKSYGSCYDLFCFFLRFLVGNLKSNLQYYCDVSKEVCKFWGGTHRPQKNSFGHAFRGTASLYDELDECKVAKKKSKYFCEILCSTFFLPLKSECRKCGIRVVYTAPLYSSSDNHVLVQSQVQDKA